MAHYAFLDNTNTVTEVIVGRDEDDLGRDWELTYGQMRGQRCKRTSYNTSGGIHGGGGVPYRKNYAGIGYTYSDELDAFIPPKTFESWVLNLTSCIWEPPVPMPQNEHAYKWVEELLQWVEEG
jgi:hypothetical protein